MGERYHHHDPLIDLANKFRKAELIPQDIDEDDPEAAAELRFLYGIDEERQVHIPKKRTPRSHHSTKEKTSHQDPPEEIPQQILTQDSLFTLPHVQEERLNVETHKPNGKKKHK